MYYLSGWEMMDFKDSRFLPFLVLMTIWETWEEIQNPPSAPGLTSEKLALIFKFIYKPWIIGFHSSLSLTNDQTPLYKLFACILSLHSVSIWILFKCQHPWKCTLSTENGWKSLEGSKVLASSRITSNKI